MRISVLNAELYVFKQFNVSSQFLIRFVVYEPNICEKLFDVNYPMLVYCEQE